MDKEDWYLLNGILSFSNKFKQPLELSFSFEPKHSSRPSIKVSDNRPRFNVLDKTPLLLSDPDLPAPKTFLTSPRALPVPIPTAIPLSPEPLKLPPEPVPLIDLNPPLPLAPLPPLPLPFPFALPYSLSLPLVLYPFALDPRNPGDSAQTNQ